MKKINTQELLETAKKRYNHLKLFFSLISIAMMLAHPIYSIYTKNGNMYINIGVLVVSIIYGFFWLILGSKKKYKINRVYKWSRLLLNLVSLLINAYSIYITATNFNFLTIIISGIMFTSWVFNVIFNIMYDVVSIKLSKFINSKKDAIKQKNLKKVEIND